MRPFQAKLSYANVMSTIAVFLALGGTSYALARNSVGNQQLKANAVTSMKVKDRSLRTSDVSPGASIGLRGARGPQGPAGPAGSVAGIAPEAWQPLGMIGGWENVAEGYQAAGFRKDKQGLVHLRGLVSQGNGSPQNSVIIAVLPPGYRPAARQVLSTHGGQLEGATRLDILPDGALTWIAGPTQERDFTTLTGLAFWPE